MVLGGHNILMMIVIPLVLLPITILLNKVFGLVKLEDIHRYLALTIRFLRYWQIFIHHKTEFMFRNILKYLISRENITKGFCF